MPYKDPEKRRECQRRYTERNKEKIALKGKEYYEKNKEIINIKNKFYKQKKAEERRKNRPPRQPAKTKQERGRENYYRHREKLLEKHRVYYQENKERLKQYQKDYRKNNPEKIKERMKRYKEENIEKFRAMEKIASAKRYRNHKEYYMTKKKEYIKKRQAFANELKLQRGCKICGGKERLEFHHRDQMDKKANISDLIYYQKNQKEFLEELDKCEVICKPCHIATHKKEGRLKRRKKTQENKIDNYI
jgi:hypothetical protein